MKLDGHLTQKEMFLVIDGLKRQGIRNYINGKLGGSLKLLNDIYDNLQAINDTLSELRERYEDAKLLGVESENHFFSVDFFPDVLPDLFFLIKHDEIDYLQRRIMGQKSQLEHKINRLDKKYMKIYKKTKIYKLDDPADSAFLNSVLFGCGDLVVVQEDRAFFKSFKINYEKCESPDSGYFLLTYSDDTRMAYTRGDLKETLLTEPKLFSSVIIQSDVTHDLETLFLIGAEKYIALFCEAEKNKDYMITQKTKKSQGSYFRNLS